jgi:two-component system KDP operon response regulator KdpE
MRPVSSAARVSDSAPEREFPANAGAVEVLLIEDELAMRRYLRLALHEQGYAMLEATSGRQGADLALRRQPSVVLLDLGLPDINGLQVIHLIRRVSAIPIIVISAQDGQEHKVLALDAGADDYLTKPFAPDELLARIRVALRHALRPAHEELPAFRSGELEVDFDARYVRVAGREVHLTPTEYKLLSVLIRSAGKVVTHRQLLHQV